VAVQYISIIVFIFILRGPHGRLAIC